MARPSGFNARLQWEQTATTNLAVDYGFFNNRISGSVDFYLKKTSDLLASTPQPAGINFAQFVLTNIGNMENKGVEFNITGQPVKNRNLTWDVNFNATYNKNEITYLTDRFLSGSISGTGSFAYLNITGEPRNTFNLLHQVYDKTTGLPIEGLFEDVNRDGVINDDDKYRGENATPNTFYGFSTNVNYKKWSAGFVLRASFNNYTYNNFFSNNGRLSSIIGGPSVGNTSANYLTTMFKGLTDNQLLSDYYIENASFLKMDNLNIGYDAGRVWRDKARLGLNFSVQNVLTVTKYKGLDPENFGIDNNFYPRPRMYSLGINLDF